LLAHGRWFSPGTPASSTTKTGRHDIAEILLKVALNTKSLKKTLLKNYENMFFEKLRSFNINNKLFLYSKIKTNYIIEPFIENSNFENRKLFDFLYQKRTLSCRT
jgi:hypothetical protein